MRNSIKIESFLLFSFLFMFILPACNRSAENEKKSCCQSDNSRQQQKELSSESVYNLTSVWTSQADETYHLSHFRKKIIVSAMIFTHCESACPRIVADMQRIEASLPETALKEIQFLLISMDPERDNPSRLREFAAEHHLGNSWTLISSNEDATMEIANVLGVRFKKLEEGGFDHSNIIHILDREGVIVYQQNGFMEDAKDIIHTINTLLPCAN